AVDDAVSGATVLVAFRAAVLVLIAVAVLGIVRPLVVDVGDAVAIVVGIGAAVLVLEAVEVLGVVGARVDVVLEAVAVAVADVRLEHDADERARLGARTFTRREAAAGAQRQERVAR